MGSISRSAISERPARIPSRIPTSDSPCDSPAVRYRSRPIIEVRVQRVALSGNTHHQRAVKLPEVLISSSSTGYMLPAQRASQVRHESLLLLHELASRIVCRWDYT